MQMKCAFFYEWGSERWEKINKNQSNSLNKFYKFISFLQVCAHLTLGKHFETQNKFYTSEQKKFTLFSVRLPFFNFNSKIEVTAQISTILSNMGCVLRAW